MPKILDYTLDYLDKALELAEAVHLVAPCSKETAAKKLGRDSHTSGSFTNLISAAKKFNLIETSARKLITTELFRKIKHADDVEEKLIHLRKAFLGVKLYNDLYERLKLKGYPEDTIRVILIRECDVREKDANNVINYFKEGAISCGLLNEDNSFNLFDDSISVVERKDSGIVDEIASEIKPDEEFDTYILTIKGPSGNLVGPLKIQDIDQFLFAQSSIKAALDLIEKKLKEKTLDEDL